MWTPKTPAAVSSPIYYFCTRNFPRVSTQLPFDGPWPPDPPSRRPRISLELLRSAAAANQDEAARTAHRAIASLAQPTTICRHRLVKGSAEPRRDGFSAAPRYLDDLVCGWAAVRDA